MIKHQLGEPLDGEYPPEFIERYPELAGVVREHVWLKAKG
jgi:hypothetical protein